MKITKYNYLIFSVALVAVALQSCKKFLDYQSPSKLNLEQTFESVEYTNSEILSIYNKAAGTQGFGKQLSMVLPMGTEDFFMKGVANWDVNSDYAVTNFGPSPANGAIRGSFAQLYQGIERANIACKYIPQSSLYTSGSAEQKRTMKQYYGEALTLRALFFSELIKYWGDVPAIFVPSADNPDQFFSHVDRDSTYKHILNDLKVAAEFVQWRSDLPAYGSFRLTKGAVKALRARIALAAGGYSLRVNEMKRRADYLDFYKIAFDECNDIIKSKQHGLNPVYENIFKSLHTSTKFDPTYEMLFEVSMWGGFNDSDLARVYGVFFRDSPTWGGGGGGSVAVPTYFYEFEKDVDIRRDVTIAMYEVRANDFKNALTATTLNCGKYRKSWTPFNGSSTNLQFGVNFGVIRYADVLLMYAEAANELGQVGEITPLSALQQVQKRAYGSNAIPITPTDQSGFFNAIVKERLLEFGGEGIRKADLIRWNLLTSKIEETRVKFTKFAWGAPTVDNPYANISQYIYYKPTVTFKNLESKIENTTVDQYDGYNNTYYTLSTVVPAGYTQKWWRREAGTYTNGVLSSLFINNQNTGYAGRFEANKKELLPYPDNAILENRGAIKQNFGY
ncbi:MAG: RagB/SusD family nutrient uptake outer membrane protein [Flavobacteriales bacterium]|nr:MAG: RagB/SusD family nutrient uptake outer membrane protein [Flavobacteriales bacterium]